MPEISFRFLPEGSPNVGAPFTETRAESLRDKNWKIAGTVSGRFTATNRTLFACKMFIFLTSSSNESTQKRWCLASKLVFVANFRYVSGHRCERYYYCEENDVSAPIFCPVYDHYHAAYVRVGLNQNDLTSLTSCLIIRQLSAHFVLWTKRAKTRKPDRTWSPYLFFFSFFPFFSHECWYIF